MKIYIPVQEGAYRHRIFGAFKTRVSAVAAAKQAIEQEPDHYHDCTVYEFESDLPVSDGCAVDSLTWNDSENRVDILKPLEKSMRTIP